MTRSTTRLAAGTLALVLPLAAAAGCGAEKKRTVKAEFASAGSHLEDSKAASFTIGLRDPQDSLKKLITKDGDLEGSLADALVGGSITYVVDPVSDRTLKDVSATPSTGVAALTKQLKDVNLSFVVRDDKAALGEFRVVDGVLFLHVDLGEIGRLAKAGGVDDFDTQLDGFVADGPPELAGLVKDVRAGEWVRLDISKYVDKLTDLAQGFTGITPTPAPGKGFDAAGLGRTLVDAVKPYVTVTDANDSSSDRVLDVKVQARPALKAALTVLKTAKDLPLGAVLGGVDPADVDEQVKDGTAKGQIRLADGHLQQVSIDVESIRALAKDAGKDSLAGLAVVLDVDDTADALDTPKDVSDVDLGALLDSFLEGFSGSNAKGSAGFSYSG